MASLPLSTVAVFIFAILTSSTSVDPTCRSQGTCEDISATEAVRASAMLQVATQPVSVLASAQATEFETGPSLGSKLHLDHFSEARDCVPIALQEMHLIAVRHHAALLSSRVKSNEEKKRQPPSVEDQTKAPTTTSAPTTTEAATTTKAPTTTAAALTTTAAPTTTAAAPPAPSTTTAAGTTKGGTGGAVASLDPAGFKETTELCCPAEMEVFFNRLLDAMGLDVCSKPHIQGLMHWFSCVPDMDFQYMIDVINNGNPCKYWGLKGQSCPALSPACAGTYCR